MFYSQTFLARKGPLGTVWCAAHLQHRLKKSHYTSTDISSSVECIMFPEVPIALRMQGHLLLGVVRIFSKKVDYLFQDSNVVMIGINKAFNSIKVDLPEEATHAPFYSVTMPDKFELDALDIDMNYDETFKDNHLRNEEDITLTDQIHFSESPYISININEDVLREVSMRETGSPPGSRQVDKDVYPQALEDPVTKPSNQTEGEENLSSRERIRNVVNESPGVNLSVSLRVDDIIEPDKEIENEIMSAHLSGNNSMEEDKSTPGGPQRKESADVFDANILHAEVSPNFALQQSSAPVVQPAVRRRKRLLLDNPTVLSNKFMKAALDNTTDIRRKRRCGSSSVFGAWKLSNKLAKEKVFLDPLINGVSEDLINLYKKDYIASKPHLAKVEKSVPESNNSSSGPPSIFSDMDIGNLRDNIDPTNESILPDALNYQNELVHSFVRCVHSPRTGDFITPVLDDDVRSIPEQPFESTAGTRAGTVETGGQWTQGLGTSAGTVETGGQWTQGLGTSAGTVETGGQWTQGLGTSAGTVETGGQWTQGFGTSAGTVRSEMSDQMDFNSEQPNLSGIPEMMDSTFEDELDFLVKEDNTPSVAISRDQGIGTLSPTTRKLAEYLKEKSSCTPISGPSSGELVLDKLVKGKTRKISARMFYETLVLKNSGLIDVHQEEPYADITLKLTPQIFKCQT